MEKKQVLFRASGGSCYSPCCTPSEMEAFLLRHVMCMREAPKIFEVSLRKLHQANEAQRGLLRHCKHTCSEFFNPFRNVNWPMIR